MHCLNPALLAIEKFSLEMEMGSDCILNVVGLAFQICAIMFFFLDLSNLNAGEISEINMRCTWHSMCQPQRLDSQQFCG